MSLRDFLEEIWRKKGEVVHVKDGVSPRFEASSIMKACDNCSSFQRFNFQSRSLLFSV